MSGTTTTTGVIDQPNQSTTVEADYFQLVTDLADQMKKTATATSLKVFGKVADVTRALEDGAAKGNFIETAYNEFVIPAFMGMAEDGIMQRVHGVSLPGVSTAPTSTQAAGLQSMQRFLPGIFQLISKHTSLAGSIKSIDDAIAQVAAPILMNQSTLGNFLAAAPNTSTINNFTSTLASQVTAVMSAADPGVTLAVVTAAVQQTSDPITNDPTDQTIITTSDVGEEIFQNVTDSGTLLGSTVIEPLPDLSGDALYETFDANGNVTSEDWEHSDGTSSIVDFSNGAPSGANYSGSFGTGTATPLSLISTVNVGYLNFPTSVPVTLKNGVADLPLSALGTIFPGPAGGSLPAGLINAKIDITSDTITVTFPVAALFDNSTPELDIQFPSNVTVEGAVLDSTTLPVAPGISSGPKDVYINLEDTGANAGDKLVLNIELKGGVIIPTQLPPPPPVTSGEYYNIQTPNVPVTTSGPIDGTTGGSIYTVTSNTISATIQPTNIDPVFIKGNGDSITLGKNTGDFTITDDGQGTRFLLPFFKGNGGKISIADFQNDKTGVFTLVDQYATPQAVVAALKPDGHGGEILSLSGGTVSLDFIGDTSLTPANFHVGNL